MALPPKDIRGIGLESAPGVSPSAIPPRRTTRDIRTVDNGDGTYTHTFTGDALSHMAEAAYSVLAKHAACRAQQVVVRTGNRVTVAQAPDDVEDVDNIRAFLDSLRAEHFCDEVEARRERE